MRVNNNERGFITLLAMVMMVTVVGGGILLGVATVDRVGKAGCGDTFNSWRDGNAYADIADNKEGAIENAQKCQEAVIKATEVAKASGALLGRASNISGNPADLIGTEIINTMMDHVERASEPDYEVIKKNIRAAKDIYNKNSEEKVEVRKNDSSCNIKVLENGTPNVLASCKAEAMGFWYSDKDGDIQSIRYRFRITVPGGGSERALAWEVLPYMPKGDSVCGFEGSFNADKPDRLSETGTVIIIDMQLIDQTGKESNISSCKLGG